MKLVSALLLAAAMWGCYSLGEKNAQDNVQSVATVLRDFNLSFGYICGIFRDPACLDDAR